MYYIPIFDYEKEGYKVLGYLNENPEIATVGYKGKVVFWFPRLGMQVMDLNEEELEITRQFLRNLYDFYGIDDTLGSMVHIKKPSNYLHIFDKEILPLEMPVMIGKITVMVEAYDEDGISKVEFYVDNKLKSIDNSSPYEWIWNEFAIGKCEIKVIA